MSTTQQRIDSAVAGRRDTMHAILERQRQAFFAEGPPSVAVRRHRIDRLLALVMDNADDFLDAMSADYGTRPKTGALFTEILGMVSVIEHTRSHVPQWMRATKLMRAGRLIGLRAEVQPSPLGVVGIIGPWNFPLNLVVLPASAACFSPVPRRWESRCNRPRGRTSFRSPSNWAARIPWWCRLTPTSSERRPASLPRA